MTCENLGRIPHFTFEGDLLIPKGRNGKCQDPALDSVLTTSHIIMEVFKGRRPEESQMEATQLSEPREQLSGSGVFLDGNLLPPTDVEEADMFTDTERELDLPDAA